MAQILDKFGPPAGGSSHRAPSPVRYDHHSSSRDYHSHTHSTDRDRDRGSYNDSYGYGSSYNNSGSGNSRHDDYRSSDRHGHHHHHSSAHDSYNSRHYADSSMNSVPSGPAAGSGDQIYIRNLPLTTTEQDLKDLFRSCGPIIMTEILQHAGRPKGSGVVRFESFESADKAVAKFNGWIYGGRSLEVIYDRA
ncbi:hypothetical protein BGZ94_004593 [Podila epigama]|nr:hypothetical protein BGZ94_004593 [Podila epigama]